MTWPSQAGGEPTGALLVLVYLHASNVSSSHHVLPSRFLVTCLLSSLILLLCLGSTPPATLGVSVSFYYSFLGVRAWDARARLGQTRKTIPFPTLSLVRAGREAGFPAGRPADSQA